MPLRERKNKMIEVMTDITFSTFVIRGDYQRTRWIVLGEREKKNGKNYEGNKNRLAIKCIRFRIRIGRILNRIIAICSRMKNELTQLLTEQFVVVVVVV